ncbi:MAG: AI-2E family transporter [Verrucomicrobiales bacterium]|nr:AI-2E family transporter [Verrucomicrobiales bacterium]
MESNPETPEPDSPKDKTPKEVPSGFQRRAFWGAITAVSIVVIGAIAVGFTWLTGFVLSYLQPVLVPLAVAGIIAYLLDPLVNWLQTRGWNHGRAMISVYVGFLALVILLAVAVIVPTFGQAQDIYKKRGSIQEEVTELAKKSVTSTKSYFTTGIAAEYYDKGLDWISNEGPEIVSDIGQALWSRLRGAFGFFGYLLGLLLVPIYLYYFLREGHKISETWTDYIPLRASKFKDEVVGTLTEVNGYLISFFRGQMVVSMIDGALVAIALSAIGLPYALLIGVFLAILGLIPYIGNLLVMVPALLIAVAHFGASEWGEIQGEEEVKAGDVAIVKVMDGDKEKIKKFTVTEVSDDGKKAEVLTHAWRWLPNVWAYPLIVLAIFLILQQINGLVTAPRIVGDSVGLHPLTVIFSVFFWSLLLGGLLGALLAVPLTAAIKVLFRRYLWERRLEPAVDKRFGPIGKSDDHDAAGRGESEPEPA